MKECPKCEKCFPDEVAECPDDQTPTRFSMPGAPLLASRYLLEKRIGRGAMGQVYVASDTKFAQRRVAVKNADVMRRFDAVGDLSEKTNGAFYGKRALAAKKFVKRLALDVFHHQIENALAGFAEVRDADRVRMLDRRGRLSFAFETRDGLAFL